MNFRHYKASKEDKIQFKNLRRSLEKMYFPKAKKKQLFLPFVNPDKDMTEPSNYRLISLLPIMEKILEKFINNELRAIKG